MEPVVTSEVSYDQLKCQIKALEQCLSEYEKTINTYRTIFNFASDAVLIHDPQGGRIVEANHKALEMFGFTRDEILSKDISSLGYGDPPYSSEEVREKIRRATAEKPLLFQWKCRKKNNSLFWVEVSLKRIVFENEEMMVAIIRDISDRKESEKEFSRLLQISNNVQRLRQVGVWELDIASQTIFWTEEVYRIHDMTPEKKIHDANQIIAKSLACFRPDDRQIFSNALKKCIEQGVSFNFEFPFTTVKRKQIWVQIEASRVRSDENDGCVIGYLRNITDSKKQQEAMQAREVRYETILQAAVDGFLLADTEGRVLEVNDAYCRMSGYEEKELLSMSIRDLDGAMAPDDIAINIKRVINGAYDRFETKHRRKDGTTYDVEISAKYISSEQGRFVNFIRDITVFKKAEKEKAELQNQLNLAQKMESIGRLAGGVAHDLNNLLAPVLGYTEMLLENKKEKIHHRAKLQSIYKGVKGAKNLVGQLLAFGRKQTLDFRLLDVDKILLGFKPLLRRTIRENIHLNIVPSTGIKSVLADQNQLEQIIMNLSVNAVDAMPDGGVLTIETTITRLDDTYTLKRPNVLPGDYVLMSFTDTGHGMDKETCHRVFEPFYSTKGTQGTGLGLATVYGIVKQHSGNIWVYSEIGKGSAFKVYFPLVRGKENE